MAETTDVIVNADQTHTAESMSIFNDAMKAVEAEQNGTDVAAPVEKKADVATTEKKAEVAAVEKSPFPDEFMGGDKKEAATQTQDDLLKQLESMELPKNAKPEQVASFKQLKDQSRKVIEQKIARITELEAKANGSSNKAEIEASNERIKAAEARALELEQTVERISFESSPRFKAQFVASEKAAVDGAKAYLAGTEINPNVIDLVMRESGPKRIAMLKEAGADAETIAAISPHLANFDAIQTAKAGALENWKANATQWEEQQKAQEEQQTQARKQEEDRIFGTVMEFAKTDLIPFKKVQGHDEWNAQVDKLQAEAKRIFNGEAGGLDVVAKTVAAGVAMPVLQKMFDGVVTQLNTLKAENAKLKAAKPDGGNGNARQQNGDVSNLSEEEQRKQRFNQNMQLAQSGG